MLPYGCSTEFRMSTGAPRCALPGCDEVIPESDDGGPRRLYCSAAHRSAARKQRQMARTSGDESELADEGADTAGSTTGGTAVAVSAGTASAAPAEPRVDDAATDASNDAA